MIQIPDTVGYESLCIPNPDSTTESCVFFCETFEYIEIPLFLSEMSISIFFDIK